VLGPYSVTWWTFLYANWAFSVLTGWPLASVHWC